MLAPLSRTVQDPVARRRLRRATAPGRRWLLPLASVVVTLLLAPLLLPRWGSTATAGPVTPPAPAVPDGRVLVAVAPADPAVLGLARPGATVDVYAPRPPPAALLDPAAAPTGARETAGRLVDRAPVLDLPAGGPPDGQVLGDAAQTGVLARAAPTAGGVLVLAVTDDEAAALAEAVGAPLTVAVHPWRQDR